MHLIKAHKQIGEYDSFIAKKGESCEYALIRSSWYEEAGGGQQDILVVELVNILNFFDWYCLKNQGGGEKMGIIDPVPMFLGCLL